MSTGTRGSSDAGGAEDGPFGTVAVDAPAKVNLLLRILQRRPDGFHELETVLQAISLADRVTVSLAEPEAGGAPEGRTGDGGDDGGAGGRAGRGDPRREAVHAPVDLIVDGAELGPPETNLAYRAASRFAEVVGLDRSVRVHLTKRIPAGAGLGGGSSDAAAVLRCLVELTGFDDEDAVRRVAAELGSDVPFFLSDSPLAAGRGRGEELTELSALPEAPLVVALPDVHVSTGEAYAELAARRSAAQGSTGRGSGAAAGVGAAGTSPAGQGNVPPPPSTTAEWRALEPESWEDVRAHAANDFEELIAEMHEEVGRSLQGLRDAGARLAMLSGSGAASFGLFESPAAAAEVAAALERRLGGTFLPVLTRSSVPRVGRGRWGDAGSWDPAS